MPTREPVVLSLKDKEFIRNGLKDAKLKKPDQKTWGLHRRFDKMVEDLDFCREHMPKKKLRTWLTLDNRLKLLELANDERVLDRVRTAMLAAKQRGHEEELVAEYKQKRGYEVVAGAGDKLTIRRVLKEAEGIKKRRNKSERKLLAELGRFSRGEVVEEKDLDEALRQLRLHSRTSSEYPDIEHVTQRIKEGKERKKAPKRASFKKRSSGTMN
jgi:hypothetical protein